MSVLLQALKTAERERAGVSADGPTAPLFPAPATTPANAPPGDGRRRAAEILSAGGLRRRSGGRSLITVAVGLAMSFLAVWGVYVYYMMQPVPVAVAPVGPFARPESAPAPGAPDASAAGRALGTLLAVAPGLARTAPVAGNPAAPGAGTSDAAGVGAAPANAAPPEFSQPPARPAEAADPASGTDLRLTLDEPVRVRAGPPEGAARGGSAVVAYDAYRRNDLAGAERGYRDALADDPASVDALLGLAAVAVRQNRPEDAAGHYGRVLSRDPRNAAAHAGLVALGGLSDPQAAESRLRTLIAGEPTGHLYFTLGNLYAGQGRWAAAEAAYFEAVRREAGEADYAYNLAVSLEHLGQARLALDYYRRALTAASPGAVFDRAAARRRLAALGGRLDPATAPEPSAAGGPDTAGASSMGAFGAAAAFDAAGDGVDMTRDGTAPDAEAAGNGAAGPGDGGG